MVYEDENLVTEAIADVLGTNIQGTLYDNPSFDGASGEGWIMPLNNRVIGGILLYQDPIEEDPSIIYAPLDNPLVGYASDDVNPNDDTQRGSRNLTESEAVDGGFKYVWDFATSQANGTISCICLSNNVAGRGCKYDQNYFVRMKADTVQSGEYSGINYRNNNRTYIAEGYRLELIMPKNGTTVTIRKVPEDYIHAMLQIRTYMKVFLEASEETEVDMGHYPYWSHYSGGSRDGEDVPYWSDEASLDYFSHAADGNWYGICRKQNFVFRKIKYGNEYYDSTGYEWFLTTINKDGSTDRAIALPDGTSSINNIGMSGKWLMFAIGTTVYKLDTTNAANLQVVANATYNSDFQFTFRVDDDVVINGWYYLDGEPKLYVRNISTEKSGEYGGQRTIARYKTYAFHEYYYYSYGYHFRKELYMYTPYLATINNLATPDIKTADQTMKITYTLTEMEKQPNEEV